MSSDLVSVVIPAYNYARYLPDAIDSVLAQTYREFEVIVVDDGSTDETPEVLGRYAGRVRVIRQKNQGEGAARNTGTKAARGPFIAFLDADDLWLPHKLERQMALLRQRPDLGWVYTDCARFDEHGLEARSRLQASGGAPPEGNILEEFIEWHPPLVITLLARADCLAAVGPFDPAFPVATDTDFLLRLAARFPAGCVNEVLALYRQHPAQVTSALPPGKCKMYWQCYWRAYAKFLQQPQPYLPRQVQQRVRGVLSERSAELACRLARDELASRRPWRTLLWWGRAAHCLWRTPSHGLGLLAEAVLPQPAARAARQAWRWIGRRAALQDRP